MKRQEPLKIKPSRSLFRDLTWEQLLFAFIYAIVTSAVGVLLMCVLYDVKINLTYVIVLTGWFFLMTVFFLHIKSKPKKIK